MNRRYALALTSLSAALLLNACAKKEVVAPPPAPPPPPGARGGGAPRPAPPPPPVDTAAERRARIQGLMNDALKPIYFDFNESSIKPEGKDVLTKVGDLLKQYPEVSVTLEGNADERGSTEYNLALGNRRADAAEKWLTTYGVSASQLKTISYGKEKATHGDDDGTWSKDRRDDIPGEIH